MIKHSQLLALLVGALFALTTLAQEVDGTGRLSGRIVDQQTGRAVADALVELTSTGDKTAGSARSASDGTFLVGEVAAGIYRVAVTAPGFRPAVEPSQRIIVSKTQVLSFELAPVRTSADVEEVVVVAARALDADQFGSVSSTVLNREEIRRAPGTAGDIFRGLNQLPGVVATGEFSNFSVRGRGPRDNLILIDDIPYDRTVHFDQSLGEAEELGGGGRFSIFGQNVVGRAEFQPGGWQAAYGGANGSLLRLGLAQGNRESAFVSVKADLAGAELLYDGPSGAFDNTSMLVSARYYNFGPLFELIGQEDLGTPELADLIVKTTTDLSPTSTLSLLAVYTPESFSRNAGNVVESEDFEDVTLLETEQHAGVIGATLEQLVGERGELRNSVYLRFADDDNRQGEAVPELTEGEITQDTLFVDPEILRLREQETELGWRLDYSTFNRFGKFSAGTRLTYLSTDYEQSLRRDFNRFDFDQTDLRPDPTQFFITLTPEQFNQSLDENALRAAIYLDQQFELGSNVTFTPGLRADYDELLGETTVSPRLSADWQVRPRTRLSATAGVFIQAPRLLEIAANAQNLDLQAEKMRQLSVGFEQYLGNDLVMLVEGYYQDLDDLLTDQDRVTGTITNNGVGETYGFDWSLVKRFSRRWSASARYGYNNARRDFRDGQGEFDADFNRPHVANVTLNYEANSRWAFAMQYQYASGAPTDQVVLRDNVLGEGELARSSLERVARNVDRLDNFSTLNVRVDYRQKLGGLSVIAFVDVINVLGNENTSSLEFSPLTGRFIEDTFGAFPQLGVTVEF